jgi:hypothetical protein
LNKCNLMRRLDSNFDSRIKYVLYNAEKKTGYKPISFEKLRERNVELYNKLLLQQGNNNNNNLLQLQILLILILTNYNLCMFKI